MTIHSYYGLNITGALVVTDLLEKARVIRQATQERSFHIFYQLLSTKSEEMRSALLLDTMSTYKFLCNGSSTIAGVDEVLAFKETTDALDIMGITDEEQECEWTFYNYFIIIT